MQMAWKFHEWLQYRRIGRTKGFEMLKNGTAPRTYFVGAQRYVDQEADREWVVALEAGAAKQKVAA